MIRKLSEHRASNCYVELSDNGNIYFYSYTTCVLAIEGGWLECYGLYSMTTRRQISWFMHEYLPDYSYHFVKELYERSERFNIYTGEIRGINK